METALTDNRRVYTRVGIAMGVQLVLGIGLQFGAQAVIAYLGWEIEMGSWGYYLVALLPQYLVAIPVSIAIVARIPKPQALQKFKLTPQQLWVTALVCICLMYAGNLAGTVISLIISALSGSQMANLMEELVKQSDVWANAVVMVLVAPVVEELFFRKLLISRLSGYGQRAAVVVSAVAFGLSHGNLSQVFYAFALGLAFGFVYVKTNRIGYTIALHMGINLLGGVVAPLLMKAGTAALSAYGMLILAAVIVGAMRLHRYKNQIGFVDEWGLPRAAWKKPALFNVGMILFYIVCVAVFALNTWWALQIG